MCVLLGGVCVNQIFEFSGRFDPTDSDFDGLYDNTLSCTWALYLPSKEGLVQLYLTDLDIQQSVDCQFDYVEVSFLLKFYIHEHIK